MNIMKKPLIRVRKKTHTYTAVRRRLTACLLAALLSWSGMLPAAADESAAASDVQAALTAEAILGSTVSQTGFETVEMGIDTTADVVLRGGEEAWLMDNQQGTASSYINMTLSSAFKGESFDGSEYVIEVDYYDSGAGYFRLYYDALDMERKVGGTAYTQNEQTWKTVAFTLQDAAFTGRTDGQFDLQLSIRAESERSPVSGASVAIRRIRITRLPAKNAIYLTASNDQVGNAYRWYDSDKIIHNKFENLTGGAVDAQITYRLISEDEQVAFEKTETLSFAPGEVKELDLNFGETERCDLYWYEVEIRSEEAGIFSLLRPFEIAILKTDPDGIVNDKMYYAAHLERYPIERSREAVALLKMGNVGGIRSDISWNRMEVSKGVYDWENHIVKPVVDALKEEGLGFLPILDTSSSLYCSVWNDLPHTPEQLEAWGNFAAYAAQQLKDVTRRYEIWNEPNISSFNINMYDADVYTEMVRVAYEKIKEVDPEAKVGAGSLAYMRSDTDTETYYAGPNFLAGMMEAEAWRYMDAITLHPYTTRSIEDENMGEVVQWYKDEFTRYKGNENTEIWNTEFGFTTADTVVGDEKTKGIRTSRTAIYYDSRELGDLNVVYNFEKKGTVLTDREDQFGVVSGGEDGCIKYGKYWIPTVSYVIMAGHNYVMAQTTADGIYDSQDGNIRMARFKSDKFQADVLTLNAVKEEKLVTLDLGTDRVTCYDYKGNAEEIIGNDGVFALAATESPVYLVGDIRTVELLEDAPLADVGALARDVAVDETIRISVKTQADIGGSLEAVLPRCAELISTQTPENGEGEIVIRNNAAEGQSFEVTVELKDGEGNLLQSTPIRFTSTAPIAAELRTAMAPGEDINYWQAILTLENLSFDRAAKGYIQFTSPELLARLGRLDIGVIPKGQTGEVLINLPEIVRKGRQTVEYDVVLDYGTSMHFSSNMDTTVATYAETKPKIDGVIERNEWNMSAVMYADSADQIRQIYDWRGTEDLSGRSGIMWDEENFYFFAEVTDDVFYQQYPASGNWQGDSVQFGVFYGEEEQVAIGQASTTYHEISLSLSPEGPVAYRFLSQDNVYLNGICEDAEIAVVRDGNTTCYEFSMPWSSLLKEGDSPKAGDKLLYSFLFNDNDGNGRRGWIEGAGGIGENKNTSLFMELLLVK